MNTTVTVQVDNLPTVKHALAEARAEIERLTAQLAERNADAPHGPYRVGERWPSDDRTVLALCVDGKYRIVRYCENGRWYLRNTPWRAIGDGTPLFWWKLPEVTP